MLKQVNNSMKTVFGSEVENQINYLQTIFKLKDNDKILDIGCHNGYQSMLLRNMGLDVIGLDIVDQRLVEYKDKFEFVNQSIYEYRPCFEFDLLIHFTLFLPDAMNPNTFDKLFESYSVLLRNGGKVLIDLIDNQSLPVGYTKNPIKPLAGCLGEYNKINSTTYRCKKIPLDTSKQPFDIYWRCFENEEFEHLATKHGLKVVAKHFDYDSNSIGSFEPNKNIEDITKRLTVILEKI
jgi:hypothetical protein